MKTNIEIIRSQFERYIEIWKTRQRKGLEKIIHPEINAWLSTCAYTPDGSQHSIFGICDFIDFFPHTDTLDYEITNFICRFSSDKARQYAEVAVKAENCDGRSFRFVAMFANRWERQSNGRFLITEMRMDVNPIGGELRELFQKVWLFEQEKAVLTETVHLPCIFPEMDSPFLYTNVAELRTPEERIADCLSHFFYGMDQFQFLHVKDALSENFVGGKYEYVSVQKFLRQPLRYQSHPYVVRNICITESSASVILDSMLDEFQPLSVQLVLEEAEWKILSIGEDKYAKS